MRIQPRLLKESIMDISNSPVAVTMQPIEASQARQVEPQSDEMQISKSKRQSTYEDFKPFHTLMRDSQIGKMENSQSMRELYTGVQNDLMKDGLKAGISQ